MRNCVYETELFQRSGVVLRCESRPMMLQKISVSAGAVTGQSEPQRFQNTFMFYSTQDEEVRTNVRDEMAGCSPLSEDLL